ncbi:hypothetical protein PM082_016570 [Marasmius tenuissimus]|nr:hypothetical protein PM082_016570 [Marasmius tenuissimus]
MIYSVTDRLFKRLAGAFPPVLSVQCAVVISNAHILKAGTISITVYYERPPISILDSKIQLLLRTEDPKTRLRKTAKNPREANLQFEVALRSSQREARGEIDGVGRADRRELAVTDHELISRSSADAEGLGGHAGLDQRGPSLHELPNSQTPTIFDITGLYKVECDISPRSRLLDDQRYAHSASLQTKKAGSDIPVLLIAGLPVGNSQKMSIGNHRFRAKRNVGC